MASVLFYRVLFPAAGGDSDVQPEPAVEFGILPSGGLPLESLLTLCTGARHGMPYLPAFTIGFCASLPFAPAGGVCAGAASLWVKTQKWLSMVFYLPVRDSVCVRRPGIWLLRQAIANERHPMDCADSAHFVLISAFTFSNVS